MQDLKEMGDLAARCAFTLGIGLLIFACSWELGWYAGRRMACESTCEWLEFESVEIRDGSVCECY
jgi:hypothetical protein